MCACVRMRGDQTSAGCAQPVCGIYTHVGGSCGAIVLGLAELGINNCCGGRGGGGQGDVNNGKISRYMRDNV